MSKKKVSVRANNIISERIKVNDLRGNPIEMAAQVVWRVTDTAQALFDVDDYKAFVNVQIEAAVRTIGSRYPYDDFEHQEVTLRGTHDQVGFELREELIARLRVAGITVDECGPYASGLCAGDRRRDAPPPAGPGGGRRPPDAGRGRGGHGGRWRSPSSPPSKWVDLDDERRAAMVSNLMVVLCGERDTQPVVNTGSLYQ